MWFPCFSFSFFRIIFFKNFVAFSFSINFSNCREIRAKHNLKEIEISPTFHALDLKRNYPIIINKKICNTKFNQLLLNSFLLS